MAGIGFRDQAGEHVVVDREIPAKEGSWARVGITLDGF